MLAAAQPCAVDVRLMVRAATKGVAMHPGAVPSESRTHPVFVGCPGQAVQRCGEVDMVEQWLQVSEDREYALPPVNLA